MDALNRLDQGGGIGGGDAVPVIDRGKAVVETERHNPVDARRFQKGPEVNGITRRVRFLYDDYLGLQRCNGRQCLGQVAFHADDFGWGLMLQHAPQPLCKQAVLVDDVGSIGRRRHQHVEMGSIPSCT